MKTIYGYHKDTGEYTGAYYAPVDPLESERNGYKVYMMPAFATDVEPPSKKTGYARVYDGARWSYTEDYRGATMYNVHTKKAIKVDKLGPLDEDHTLVAPIGDAVWSKSEWAPREVTLEEQSARVREIRDGLLSSSDVKALPDYPHATEEDRQAWLDYRAALRDITTCTGFPFEVEWPLAPDEKVAS